MCAIQESREDAMLKWGLVYFFLLAVASGLLASAGHERGDGRHRAAVFLRERGSIRRLHAARIALPSDAIESPHQWD
jgi:hypothetical protein